jgi:hypothetical protein
MTTPEHDRTPDDARGPIHDFADGEIQSYAGRVNVWLMVVYVILVVWAAYYLFVHWGGLGPGLEGPR